MRPDNKDRDKRGRGPKVPLSPKPFELIAGEKNPFREHPPGHEQFMRQRLITGKLKVVIDAISPVHIATGAIELLENLGEVKGPTTSLIKEAIRTRGRKFIPGSTLKGATRLICESVTASCMFKTRLKVKVDRQLRECTLTERLCVTCRMFGAPNFKGRLVFNDAELVSGDTRIVSIPQLHPPQDSSSAYGSQGDVASRKFYHHQSRPANGPMPVEVAATGSRFSTCIYFQNLKPEELGLLLCVLGVGSQKFNFKIGAGRPYGLGSVRATVESLELVGNFTELYSAWDASPFVEYLGDALTESVASYSEKAQPLLVESQWQKVYGLLGKVTAPPPGPY